MSRPGGPYRATGLARVPRAVGWTSLALTAVGLARPRELAALAGVRSAADDAALPVLVRLAAARQGVLGLALLTRVPVDVQRSAGLFLPLTAADLATVAAGTASGVLAPRAAALASAVLAVNAAVLAAARRPRSR